MAKKELINLTTLFVDIVDSIELANYLSPIEYDDFLNEFQSCVLKTISFNSYGIKELKISGDELVVFYSSKDIAYDIVSALLLAINLKIGWYISKTNIRRVKDGKKILDLGTGINTGKAILGDRPHVKETKKFISNRKTYEGFAISLTKRIESFSRQGRYSKIMIGQNSIAEFQELHHNYEFHYTGLQKLKGLSQEIPIFELKSCYSEAAEIIAGSKYLNFCVKQLEEIKKSDPSNIWIIMILINIYSQKKNYKKVEKLCKEAIVLDNSVANIHSELANVFLEQKKYDEALLQVNAAINLRPSFWDVYSTKEAAFIMLKQYDDAINICNFVIKNGSRRYLSKDGLGHYYNLAAAYARKDERVKSLRYIKRLVKSDNKEMIDSLKKDKDEDFINLRNNAEFNKIIR